MTRAAIQTDLDNTQFVPGQALSGRVGWQSKLSWWQGLEVEWEMQSSCVPAQSIRA